MHGKDLFYVGILSPPGSHRDIPQQVPCTWPLTWRLTWRLPWRVRGQRVEGSESNAWLTFADTRHAALLDFISRANIERRPEVLHVDYKRYK